MKSAFLLDESPILYGFAAWLTIATKGLCDEARERVAKELKDHFDAEVGFLGDGGLSVDEANAEALRRLGSPKAASRALRNTNLTIADEHMLAVMQGRSTKYSPNPKLIGWIMLFGAASYGVQTFSSADLYYSAPNSATVSLAMLFAALPFWYAPRLHASGRVVSIPLLVRRVALIQSVIALGVFVLSLLRLRQIAGATRIDYFGLSLTLTLTVVCVAGTIRCWRLSQKLSSRGSGVKS